MQSSSSVTNRLAAVADIGGVNSFRSFARSWQRAANFHEVIPSRPSFVYADDAQHFFADPADEASGGDEGAIQYGRSYVDPRPAQPQASLLRQHFEASPPSSADAQSTTRAGPSASVSSGTGRPDDFRERENKALDPEAASERDLPSGSSFSSIFAVPPHLAAPSIVGSYGSHRGSPYGTLTGGSLRHRVSVISGMSERTDGGQGDEADEDEDAALGEHQPILVKEVKQGNKVVLAVEGQSTLPQSVFNSINALIGVGLLSLPLAFKMSGWILGLLILSVTAAVTAYTAKLLARCMDVDPSLITYSDLAYVSFGTRARVVVSALFSLELIAACVALVILFADSLDLLLPGLASVNSWKCVCAALILVLNAMPLRWLSYTSVIGIFSTFCSTSTLVATFSLPVAVN
jgi:vesicular inhibitory amino acid transporter